jgi:hypothetical protein
MRRKQKLRQPRKQAGKKNSDAGNARERRRTEVGAPVRQDLGSLRLIRHLN